MDAELAPGVMPGAFFIAVPKQRRAHLDSAGNLVSQHNGINDSGQFNFDYVSKWRRPRRALDLPGPGQGIGVTSP
jgi:hypothetical protein